jgi:hypothetical protein
MPPFDLNAAINSAWYPESCYAHQQAIHDSDAANLLMIGGYGSGKSKCLLLHALFSFVLRFGNCDALLLRRKFRELEQGLVSDLKKLWPPEIAEKIYTLNSTKLVATFFNGSRIFFGSCTNNSEADLDQYLSSSFAFIGVDEAGQFRHESWSKLQGRNRLNPGVKPDANGAYPIPQMMACTNPFGIGFGFIKALWIDHKPWRIPEGAVHDTQGRYYMYENGKPVLMYDPKDYFYTHSTVLENPNFLRINPKYLKDLQALPPELKKLRLYGDPNVRSGQYYGNFSESYHVCNLRKHPDAIVWQDWEVGAVGWDFGLGHFSGILFGRRALYKAPGEKSYKSVIVIYREIAKNETSSRDLVALIKNSLGETETIQHIFFSHEKFSRSGTSTSHRPADDVTNELREVGLPPVTPACNDRIAGAVYLWQLIEQGDIVFLDNCKDIIAAMPGFQRGEGDRGEDVLKTDTKADDLFDALKYLLLGFFNPVTKPKAVKDAEKVAKMPNDGMRYQYLAEQAMRGGHADDVIKQITVPNWMDRVKN